ncbi:uncharacterized protein A4U43_C07F28440 [Asparagus officinalis]|uniref:U3 small nucleolar RNA-associated protein 25 n=1 Tax=Asparagus officinalis TaxID=4686 RepID=A0A5P1EFN7_ASPOF|nr:U3 small nucleolar RNA-associated protein 25 isoform X2 [Asparagus officinalis]ONK64654.1 uncharacterized protein A4U43_C07F28440 [Asparagus officinalis]
MGKQLAKKRVKRSNPLAQVEDTKKRLRKKSNDLEIQTALPSSAGSLSSDEEDVHNEQVAFDCLLNQLGSRSDKMTSLYKRRRREQKGLEEDEEDEEDGDEYSMFDGENGGEEGSDSEPMDDSEGEYLRRCGHSQIMKQREEHETGDKDAASSGDDTNGSENDSHTNVDEIASICSFHRHLEDILTDEHADELTKSIWKYKWEMPATGRSMSKWMGTGERLSMEVSSDSVYGVKQKLYKHWLDIFKASAFADLDPQLRFFFSLCHSYRDIMHCNKKPFYLKGEEDSVIMDAYLMHALDHVFKTRDLVSKNNAKISTDPDGKMEEILSASNFLDHGFTRPKVMFLLPLGSIALHVVKRLIQLIPTSNKTNIEHMDRFLKEFGTDDTEEEDKDSKTKKPVKPKDFQRLFGGNNNDHFMIGIKITKRSIKFYHDFYSSDIIIASPLGLIAKIGEAEAEKAKDVDYLSSIELLIIDHADVIAMQNWSHLNTVVEQLNHMPSKQHQTDVMRIRQWYLNGHARFYRQTILLGAFLNPDMNALFNRSCMNYEGKVKLLSEYKGVLPKVLPQVKQVYQRFDASSIVDVDDARLDYFSNKVFPKIKDSVEGGIMLFVSSYFEYVRVRNFLTSQNASFCLFGDYAEPRDISRARVWFFEGKRKIMLYTERAHFYRRYKIRGIKNLFIYSLPERKEFYPEIINMLEGSNNLMCNVLFSRFDHLRLERVVGTGAAKRMVSSDKKIFVFA